MASDTVNLLFPILPVNCLHCLEPRPEAELTVLVLPGSVHVRACALSRLRLPLLKGLWIRNKLCVEPALPWVRSLQALPGAQVKMCLQMSGVCTVVGNAGISQIYE